MTLLGGLQGTATRLGLQFFADQVLPRLNRMTSLPPFEVHVIGGGELPSEAQNLVKSPLVKRRGYVENIVPELSSTDVFLVPTPIPLGIRVRVLTALSYGVCIVAHQANASGIPELVHDQNSLLSSSPQQMTEHIVRALTDANLRDRLSEGARRTYEENFSEETAAQRILDDVVSMAGTPAPSNSLSRPLQKDIKV